MRSRGFLLPSVASTAVLSLCLIGCVSAATCPADIDGDGFLAKVDRCPNAKEDGEKGDLRDGCPHDPDGDGFIAERDACPFEAESRNGYQDSDGCPDTKPAPVAPPIEPAAPPPTAVAKAEPKPPPLPPLPILPRSSLPEPSPPKVAADGHGKASANGNIGISLPESLVVGASAKAQPELPRLPIFFRSAVLAQKRPAGPSLDVVVAAAPTPAPTPVLPAARIKPEAVVLVGNTIQLNEKIMFETDSDKIDRESDSLVRNIAQTILAHPELDLIEVAGHADHRGSAPYNLSLTMRRSEAVQIRLQAEGVAGKRLRAAGYGYYCPVDPAENLVAYEKNRRVELLVIRRNGKPTEHTWGGCAAASAHGVMRVNVHVK